jgi:hypothetical protein
MMVQTQAAGMLGEAIGGVVENPNAPRVGGEFDRHINVDDDRRANVRVDPRQNY